MKHISPFDSQNLVLQSLGWSLLQGQIITSVEHQVPNGRKESFQSITRKNAFFLPWDSEICHSILENTSSALLQSNVTSSGRRLIQPEYETFLSLKLGLRLQETRPVSDAWNNEEVIPLPFTNWFAAAEQPHMASIRHPSVIRVPLFSPFYEKYTKKDQF
jgi:hypothetical protein